MVWAVDLDDAAYTSTKQLARALAMQVDIDSLVKPTYPNSPEDYSLRGAIWENEW